MQVDQENNSQPPLELSHRVLDTGGAAVEIGGELDVATADAAFPGTSGRLSTTSAGPLWSAWPGCGFATHGACTLRSASPSTREQVDCRFPGNLAEPWLARLMQITGLGETFLAAS